MSLNRNRAQKYLQKFDFESLFIEELGWDTVDRVMLPFEVDGELFEVVAIAQKRGFTVFKCITTELPARPLRVKLDRQLTDYSKSHLLVFGDEGKTQQTWMWVRQELGKPLAPRFEQYQVGQSAERLLQKLEALAIAFAEEEKLTLVEVAQRVKKAFDVEKVTKKFFTRFEQEHGQFLKFIDGIQSEFDRTWYASLMLNRLMFVYFIQKKNFLGGDINYLRNRMKRCQAEWGTDTFHSFYRQFLLKLFHEGLGKPGRDAELDKLLGKVPYLNGGLFEVHQLEEKYEDTIQVPDAAFEQVFNFFDEYDWHLDDRPLRNQNEINPDVLGYIFEKYINQKQMGAYYTKEDITEYISKNTIIPFLFDAAEKACKIAFKPDGALWALLRENGGSCGVAPCANRYIYSAVCQGVDLELPAEIAAGIEDVSQRGGWNKPAAAGFALPTETWREHVARRKRCLELRQKLAAGEVTSINDLITYNLDIRQFAQDVITSCESSDLLKAFYQAIEQVSVLDPTCGSGAFLFAALNILEPLYTACLERIQGFVDEDDLRLSREADAKPRYEKFRTTLAEMAKHPNPRYFVLKSIMLNNLYGVDIMEEATEICKLRLFLKLVAQMEAQPKKDNFGLEPLPDIDFNIRAGNTLVGFASLDEVRKAIKQDGAQLKLDLQDDASRIDEKAELADLAFQRFRQMQTEFGMNAGDFRESKKELRRRLAELNDELNRYLAREYGVDADKPAVFEKWRESHQPFHWFIEFYSIIDRGGFDVIIGNPPYLENTKLKSQYSINGYSTFQCGNIYACVLEKAYDLLSKGGRSGFIVPLSLVCTKRTSSLRSIVIPKRTWISCFDMRPSSLFEGVAQRLSIILAENRHSNNSSVGGYRRWTAEERNYLIETTIYTSTNLQETPESIAKLSNDLEGEILKKISGESLEKFIHERSEPVYIHRIVRYFVKALSFIPLFIAADGTQGKSDDYKKFCFLESAKISNYSSVK
ncbi:Eco57I restriction-modification methylase domain-containing protein [Phormidesmis priestleyi]